MTSSAACQLVSLAHVDDVDDQVSLCCQTSCVLLWPPGTPSAIGAPLLACTPKELGYPQACLASRTFCVASPMT